VDDETQLPELLYQTTDPYEVPLVMPMWARTVPILAEKIDAGYEQRRAAGLPIDGTRPATVWDEREALVREYYLAPFRMGVAPPPSPWPQGAVDAAPSQSN